MTESDAKTKPLHEVWGYFTRLDSINRRYMQHPEFAQTRIDAHKMLRGVLLERCRKFGPDNTPLFPTIMHIFEGKDGVSIQLCTDFGTTSGAMSVGKDQLKDLSAMTAFWDWELEQRQREQEKEVQSEQ